MKINLGMDWTEADIITEEVYEDGTVGNDDVIEEEYLVGDDFIEKGVHDISHTLDQSAAQNLIFMAQEGGGSIAMGDLIEEQVEQADNEDYNNDQQQVQQYFECQEVTEEVITDDWVQQQQGGEERVEIIIDSLGQTVDQSAAAAHAIDDVDVSLPTDQDEYLAARPHPCDFCSRRFKKLASLENHMIIHQIDKPNICRLCGARYNRRTDLLSHLKNHAYDTDSQHEFHVGGDGDADCIPERDPLADDQDEYGAGSSSHHLQHRRNNSSSSGRFSPEYHHHHHHQQQQSYTKKTGSGKSRSKGRSRLDTFDKYLVENDVKRIGDMAQQHENYTRPPRTERHPVLDQRKPFVCQQCGLAFAREKALLSHVKSHGTDAPLECSHCGEMFWDKALLQQHEATHEDVNQYKRYTKRQRDAIGNHHNNNNEYGTGTNAADDEEEEEEEEDVDDDVKDVDYVVNPKEALDEDEPTYIHCEHCNMAFRRKAQLRLHMEVHYPGRRVKQEQREFGNDAHNARRQNNDDDEGNDEHEGEGDAHADGETFQCGICGIQFEDGLEMMMHSDTHAKACTFQCQVCGDRFTDEARLQDHVIYGHKSELKVTSCRECGKECRDIKALMKHSWDHSQRDKRYTCMQCKKQFQNKARLKRHQLSHRNKSVQCDVCSEEFPDGRSLMNHRHSHSSDQSKKFPCNVCGKTFGSRSSQQIHIRMHTGEKPYECKYCWKAFADGGTLRKHERIHTGEKPYECPVCLRAFNQRVVLREHIRSHHSGPDPTRVHSDYPYLCSVCQDEFSTPVEMIQHLIGHSDENTQKSRPVQVGPRKYQRRRKGKTEELKRSRRPPRSNEQQPRQRQSLGGDEMLDYSENDGIESTEEFVPTKMFKDAPRYNNDMDLEGGDYSENNSDQDRGAMMAQQQPHMASPPKASNRSLGSGVGGNTRAAASASSRPKMIHTEKMTRSSLENDGKRRNRTLIGKSAAAQKQTVQRSVVQTVSRVMRRQPKPMLTVLSPLAHLVNIKTEPLLEGEDEQDNEEEGASLDDESVEFGDRPASNADQDDDDDDEIINDEDLDNQMELMKRNSDKYSVDIVNDLEAILRSPIRSKLSESSITSSGYDFMPPPLASDSLKEVVVVEQEAAKRPERQSAIECRRMYMPLTKPSPSAAPLYVAKIAIPGGSNSERNRAPETADDNDDEEEDEEEQEVEVDDDLNETTLEELLYSRATVKREPVEIPEQLFTCDICSVVFATKIDYRNHVRSHF